MHAFNTCSPTRGSKFNVGPLCVTMLSLYCVADNVDKRGRKVKQSSSEDLRKYYRLEGMCQYMYRVNIIIIP